jgi:hypothetical protein
VREREREREREIGERVRENITRVWLMEGRAAGIYAATVKCDGKDLVIVSIRQESRIWWQIVAKAARLISGAKRRSNHRLL